MLSVGMQSLLVDERIGQRTHMVDRRRLRYEEMKMQESLQQAAYEERLTEIKRKPLFLNSPETDRNIYNSLCCQRCLPSSRSNISKSQEHGFKRDILNIKSLIAQKGTIYPSTNYMLENRETLTFLHNDRTKSIIFSIFKFFYDKISILFSKIIGTFNYSYFLRRHTSKLIVHSSQIELLEKTLQAGAPVVYVLWNNCPLDYYFLNSVFYYTNIKLPIIFMQKEQKIKFGWLQKMMGCCFVPFSDSVKQGELMKLCFQNNLNILVSISNPSYVANSMDLKIEQFANIVKLCDDKQIDDVVLVPIILSYEKLPVENTDVKKKIELLGITRITINQPFSLIEFISAWDDETCTLMNDRFLITKYDFDLFNDIINLTEALIQHILYDLIHSQPFMSTNLIFNIILSQLRSENIDISSLFEALENFQCQTNWDKTKVMGFKGDVRNVVNYVFSLHSDLFSKNGDTYLMPTLDSGFPSQLFYYSNVISSSYALLSVVSTVIYYLTNNVHDDLFLNRFTPHNFQNFFSLLPVVFENEIIQLSLDLCMILKNDFVFTKPCIPLDTAIKNIIMDLMGKDILIDAKKPLDDNEEQAHRLARNFDDDEDEEFVQRQIPAQKYVLNNDGRSENFIRSGKLYIEPYLDIYSSLCNELTQLLDNSKKITESEFVNDAFEEISKISGNLKFQKIISKNILKQSLKLFEDLNVICRFVEEGKAYIVLHDSYKDGLALNNFGVSINKYRSTTN